MDDNGFDSINIVPMVDIMLVLLTIVLTTSTFIAAGVIPVELPEAKYCEGQALKGEIIEIDKNGLLYMDGKVECIAGLTAKLLKMDRETPVLIRADKSVKLQVFVEVMDIVKSHGFKKVSLQTQTT